MSSRRRSGSRPGDDGSFPTFGIDDRILSDVAVTDKGYDAFFHSVAAGGAGGASSFEVGEGTNASDSRDDVAAGGGAIAEEDFFDQSTISTSDQDNAGVALPATRREEAATNEHFFSHDEDEIFGNEDAQEIEEPDGYDDEWDDGIEINTTFDDNPHRNSIVSNIGMKSPAVREMNENAIFAKRAGLRYSESIGYDVQSSIGSLGPLEEDDIDNTYLSPRHTPRHHGFFNNFFRRSHDDEGHAGAMEHDMEHVDDESRDEHGNALPPNATFLRRSHDSDSNEDLAQLRLLAGQLSADWRDKEFIAPALARRLRDFQFAQEKRRKKYGNERPWGILGLYDHLAGVRMDVEWAEDAAWRRANGEPYCAWSEFEASKNAGFNRPFFTYFILIVCTGVLIASIGLNGWAVEPLSVNPMIGPSAETLVRMGAKETYLIVNENQAWRLVSPMVLHAGLIHYFLNILALWFIGSAVEQSHGFIPALVLFIIPAIGGTVLSAIFLPEYITVGASGGIFGLIGACLSDIVMNWKLLFSDFVNQGANKKRHAVVLALLFLDIIVNCLLGLTPFVDNFTHLGGMLFGFLCGLSTMERVSSDFFGVEEQRCWAVTKNIFARFFGLIVSIASIMAATIILLEGDGVTNPCSSCSALSCVTFPPWADQSNKWWYCDDCGSVTADARVNPATGTFHQLDMTCPDGSMQNISLDGTSKDKAWLETNLPTFCREHCPSVNKS